MRIVRVLLLSLIVCFLLPASLAHASTSNTTLSGYWKLDEASRTDSVIDSSGFGLNGTSASIESGGPTPSTDVPSVNFTNPKSRSFGGTDYIEVANNSNLNPTSAVTISAWIKLTTADSSYHTIAGKWYTGVRQQYLIQLNDSGKIGFWTGNGSTCADLLESTNVISAGSWVLVTGTQSGTTKTLYINGSQNATKTSTCSLGSSTALFGIGSKYNDTGSYFEFFNGKIDDVRVYSRALSSGEVSDLSTGHTSATWTGGTSTSFETASNWNTGAVPDPYSKVVIADTTNDPVLSANLSLYSLTINSGAILTTNCYTITYNDGGSLTNNGTVVTCNSPPTTTSVPSAPSCTETAPAEIPDLFKIDVAGTYVNLYFTSVFGAGSYSISYGLDQTAKQYGDQFNWSGKDWVIGRTVSHLEPNTDYYFKVRAVKGCNAGSWSQILKVHTQNRFSDVTQWFANLTKPKPTPQDQKTNVLGISTECDYTVKEGDSLWSISQMKWGDGTQYSQILTFNPSLSSDSILQIGQNLKLCN